MKSPSEAGKWLKEKIRMEWKVAFVSAFLLGLLIHLPIMLSDIQNHDGLDSMYFDQNMITSGRWFLSIACGFSSYYNIPWVIGILGMVYLSLASVVLVDFLEVHNRWCIVVISGLLVSFPALASTFAYVFTLDGYMLALLLAILAVALTKRYRWGFLGGMICLGLSMGTYQAYLPFAVLLCLYGIVMLAISEMSWKEKIRRGARYLYMGVLGVVFYYGMLQLLLKIQGKELDTYQGISDMGSGVTSGLLSTLRQIYSDFLAFTLKGNVLSTNVFATVALLIVALLAFTSALGLIIRRKWWKSPWLYLIVVFLAVGVPVATNIILVVSPDVTYHLLMRYQWVLLIILMVAFVERYGSGKAYVSWGILLGAGVLVFCYGLADNIAYSNLQKRYEKTYAYCLRLLDRIEQTEGYYQGIPIAMVGVVSDEEYPVTDITQDVTSGMIGISGDSLLYTGENYALFMKYYLGASLNILPAEAMSEAYYEDFYREMDSFPAESSIQIVDGVMYIKTENKE